MFPAFSTVEFLIDASVSFKTWFFTTFATTLTPSIATPTDAKTFRLYKDEFDKTEISFVVSITDLSIVDLILSA